jgi:hypothetical protein
LPRRVSPLAEEFAYRMLVYRDGEICRGCGLEPSNGKRLEKDHIDNDGFNWKELNLQLLCKSCNTIKGNRERHSKPAPRRTGRTVIPGGTLGERERLMDPTSRVNALVDRSAGSVENQLNDLFEPRFVAWIREKLQLQGMVLKADALNSGAYVIGCSTTATRKYLDKWASPEGPFMEVRTPDGHRAITLRETQEVPVEARTNGHKAKAEVPAAGG